MKALLGFIRAAGPQSAITGPDVFHAAREPALFYALRGGKLSVSPQRDATVSLRAVVSGASRFRSGDPEGFRGPLLE